MRAVELYAGTGRSLAPFTGWRMIEQTVLVDNNHYARNVYLHNHKKANYVLADITKVQPKNLESWAGGPVQILLGCPPCQGYSDSGLRDANDPRNHHVLHFARIAVGLRPLAICMENVPGLVKSRLFKRMCIKIERAGYKWTASIVNAATWGSSQTRQRLVYIALRDDVGTSPQFPRPTHGSDCRYFNYATGQIQAISEDPVGLLGITPVTQSIAAELPANMTATWGAQPIPTVEDAIGDLPMAGSKKGKLLEHIPPIHGRSMLQRMGRVPEGGRWRGGEDHFSQSYGRLHRLGLARTITGSFANAGSGRYWHPIENRALTIREAARIQGFEDGFTFLSGNGDTYTLIGNALDAALARLCYRRIRRYLE
jgi:DNA (cytosine-5)-methyltransferase 1